MRRTEPQVVPSRSRSWPPALRATAAAAPATILAFWRSPRTIRPTPTASSTAHRHAVRGHPASLLPRRHRAEHALDRVHLHSAIITPSQLGRFNPTHRDPGGPHATPPDSPAARRRPRPDRHPDPPKPPSRPGEPGPPRPPRPAPTSGHQPAPAPLRAVTPQRHQQPSHPILAIGRARRPRQQLLHIPGPTLHHLRKPTPTPTTTNRRLRPLPRQQRDQIRTQDPAVIVRPALAVREPTIRAPTTHRVYANPSQTGRSTHPQEHVIAAAPHSPTTSTTVELHLGNPTRTCAFVLLPRLRSCSYLPVSRE